MNGLIQQRTWPSLDIILRAVVCAFLLVAAVSKLVNPVPFWAACRYIIAPTILERGPLIALATGVVVLEVCVALSLVLWPRSRWPAVAAIASLALFSLALYRLVLITRSPSCGCFGVGHFGATAQQENLLAMTRNAGLIVASIRMLFVAHKPRSMSAPAAIEAAHCLAMPTDARGRERAFSIVELLVVIAVVAVLMAITLPALRSARQQAEGVRSLSNHRQNLAAITMYTSDQNSWYPYLGVPGDAFAKPTIEGWASIYGVHYFGLSSRYWPTVVFPRYLDALDPRVFFPDASEPSRLFQFTGAGAAPTTDPWVRTLVWMTHTTAAAPAFWEGATPPEDVSLLRGMKATDVASPSAKGLLLDTSVGVYSASSEGSERKKISVGMCDGSAAWRDYIVDASGLPPNAVERPGLGAIPWPIMTTRRGVAGRDFQAEEQPASSPPSPRD